MADATQGPNVETPNPSFGVQLDYHCDAFEAAWQRDQSPRLEESLSQFPPDRQAEALRELLAIELLYRLARGEQPDSADYSSRFSDHATIVAQVFTSVANRSTAPDTPSDQAPSRYRIVRPHARGGLADVYVAEDREFKRLVALKEIQSRFVGSEEARARFLREAEITGKLEHPGIVPAYGLGVYSDGRPHLAMRLIEGTSLHDAIAAFHSAQDASPQNAGQRLLEFHRLLRRFIDVCNAVDYAHSRGIIHRDLKPANIMLGAHGETLVIDWGLAKALDQPEPSAQPLTNSHATPPPELDQTATRDGDLVGTPAFMSPEQAAGRHNEIGPATDIYSLGATLYVLLTGQPPFTADDAPTLLPRIQSGQFPPPRKLRPDIPPPLQSICLHALAPQPSQRYPSCRALADDIERWLADEPIPLHREPLPARLSRWSRKHRATVSTTIGILVATVAALTIGIVVVSAEKREKEAQRAFAVQQQGIADEQRIRAQNQQTLAERQTKIVGELQRSALELNALAKRDRDAAAELRKTAQRERDRAALLNYSAQIRAAETDWKSGNTLAAQKRLKECLPDRPNWEYEFLRAQCAREISRLDEDPFVHNCLAVSPDGKQVATGGFSQIRLFDVGEGGLVYRHGIHNTILNGVAFYGDKLVSLCNAGIIRIHDLASGEELRRLVLLLKHGAYSSGLAVHPETRRIAACGSDGVIIFSDDSFEKPEMVLRTQYSVANISFSPDGSRLAAISYESPHATVVVCNVSDGAEIFHRETRGPPRKVTIRPEPTYIGSPKGTVAFSPDGRQLAVSYGDELAEIWNACTGEDVLALRHGRRISSLAISHDGKWMATVSRPGSPTYYPGEQGMIRVWNVYTGHHVWKFDHPNHVTGVAFSPDGNELITCESGALRRWSLDSSVLNQEFEKTRGKIVHLAFSPDNGRVAVGSTSYPRFFVKELGAGQSPLTLEHQEDVWSCSVSANWERAITVDYYGQAWTWELLTGRELACFTAAARPQLAGFIGSDHNRAITLSNEGHLQIWDAGVGKEIASYPLQNQSHVSAAALSKCGRFLAVAGEDKTLKTFNLETVALDVDFGIQVEKVTALAFDFQGKRVSAGFQNGMVNISDLGNRDEILQITTGSQPIKCLEFHPEGARLAISAINADIMIFELRFGFQLLSLDVPKSYARCLAFSPDGKRLLSGADSGSIQLWDACEPSKDETKSTVVLK